MGSRSKYRPEEGHKEGGALRLLVETACEHAGAGGVTMTIWTPGRELTPKDREELHDYLLERWGATFAGSIG